MNNDFNAIRIGAMLAMLTLIFGIGMGVLFGANEDAVKDYIKTGVSQNAALHDDDSESKIWRYAQRAHFHATGVGAFAMGMILLTGVSNMSRSFKTATSVLIGIGSFYALAWLSMFLLSPSMGRDGAHEAFMTEAVTMVTVGSMLLGVAVLSLHLMFGLGKARS